METYIILLRGINVSGQKIIKMEVLREILSQSNFSEVQTYIQSGNIVLRAHGQTPKQIEAHIAQQIQQHFGFAVEVFAYTLAQFRQQVAQAKFPHDAPDNQLYISFLRCETTPETLAKLAPAQTNSEQVWQHATALYLYCPNGYGKTKLTNTYIEQKLKTTATTRNLKTSHTLIQMAEKIQAK